MVAMSTVFTQVEAPAVVPHPFGLFSVVSPTNPAGTAWQAGVKFRSVGCVDVAFTEDACISGNTVPPKVALDCATGGDYSQYRPFTVLAYFRKSGESTDVAEAEASAALEGGEEYAVETKLWAMMIAASAPTAPPANNKYTNPVAAMLADVEIELGKNYHGTGLIHMSRGVASALGDVLVRVGDRLETMAGTPVIAGAGYNNAGNPATIYGTGPVVVNRGSIEVVEAVDTARNDFYALAERTYVVGWDCFVYGRSIA